MKDIHCPSKPDYKKPLYEFNDAVVSNELISALKDNYEYRRRNEEIVSFLYLVPSEEYFIHTKSLRWACSEVIKVTEEQADEFLALHSICGMPFLEFMESKNEK